MVNIHSKFRRLVAEPLPSPDRGDLVSKIFDVHNLKDNESIPVLIPTMSSGKRSADVWSAQAAVVQLGKRKADELDLNVEVMGDWVRATCCPCKPADIYPSGQNTHEERSKRVRQDDCNPFYDDFASFPLHKASSENACEIKVECHDKSFSLFKINELSTVSGERHISALLSSIFIDFIDWDDMLPKLLPYIRGISHEDTVFNIIYCEFITRCSMDYV